MVIQGMQRGDHAKGGLAGWTKVLVISLKIEGGAPAKTEGKSF